MFSITEEQGEHSSEDSDSDAEDAGIKAPSTSERKEEALRCRQRIVKTDGRRLHDKVFEPSLVDRVRHSTRGLSTVHYLTTGPAQPKEPTNPYLCQELPSRVRSSGYAAPTYKWRETASLRERLRVVYEEEEQPKKDKKLLPEVKRMRVRFVRKSYQDELKKRTLANIISGYVSDEIKTNEENAIIVQFSLQQAQQEIDKASKSMAEFLSQEQKNCQSLTKKLNLVLEAKKKRELQIENEKKKMSEVKLKIFHHNEYLEKMRKCREFVLNVAPEDWKIEYEKETLLRQENIKDDIFKLEKALLNYKMNCAGEDPGLEKVLQDFIKEYSTAGPPSLPYEDPHRVFSLFRDLELKSMRALHHNAQLKKAVEKAKSISMRCDTYFKNEKNVIQEKLHEIKNGIISEKKCVGEKKELLKNLKDGPFRNLIASEDILLEHILIKDVYKELIHSPKEGLGTLKMLQEIGELYFDLNRRLEKLPLSKKKSMEKQMRETLDMGMRNAEKAERRKKQIESMIKGLRRAREKPWKKTGRPLLSRSRPKDDPKTLVEDQKASGPTSCSLVLKEDLESNFQLVYASNHPGPGPYRTPPSPPDLLADYKRYYPDLTIVDTDEEAALISESEEEKEGKKKIDPSEEKKKVKRKKPKKIVDSDDTD